METAPLCRRQVRSFPASFRRQIKRLGESWQGVVDGSSCLWRGESVFASMRYEARPESGGLFSTGGEGAGGSTGGAL